MPSSTPVLFKPLLCDTLLCIAEEGLFQPLCFPAAMVTGHRTLIDAMSNQPKDRHVLAAAVRGRAELIVTQNLRDFPPAATAPYDVEVINQDAFLLDQQDLDPAVVRQALTRQVPRYRREPRTVDGLLIALGRPGNGCPHFATACRAQDAEKPEQ